jgi:hypothetical protein
MLGVRDVYSRLSGTFRNIGMTWWKTREFGATKALGDLVEPVIRV